MGGMVMNISQDNTLWKFPHYEVGQAIDWEVLTQKFECLSDMKGVEQDALWHSEGDVYTHTKMVVEALVALEEFKALPEQKQHILFTSALFHDIEKRSTTKRELRDGIERVVSPRHAQKGENTVRSMLYREIETPFKVREEIVKLIRHHGVPLFILESNKPQRKAIQISLILDTSLLYLLAKADVLGRECIDKENILENIELFKELCLEYECFGKPRKFVNDYARFIYLNKEESLPDYEPYDDFKFTVYLMSAIPASGKDTYIKEHLDVPILSLDNIRRKHKIKPTDKKGTGRVVQMAKEQAKIYMREKQSFVFNATNISKDMRAKWISLFLDYKAKVEIIYIEVPYKQLKKQNANRDYPIPLNVIDKLFDKIEIPCFDEGHGIKISVGGVC